MALPTYEMVINPEENSEVEVSFVALVDKPAIEKNFLAFKDQTLQFAINDEKRIISGPAMIANQLIYRKDAQGEYNVFFSPETIRDIAIKFFKKGYQKNLNLFHDPSLSLEGVTIFESFVTDSSRGIQPMKGFEDTPEGTLFLSAKVDNDDVWAKIKSGEVKGFSVEGIFSFLKMSNGPLESNLPFNAESNFMSDIKELWNQFKERFLAPVNPAAPAVPAAPVQLTETTLKDGTPVTIDRLEVGGVVMVGDAPAPAGTHELADGTKVTVAEGGVIAAIEAVEVVEAEATAPTDYTNQFAAIDEKFTAYETKFSEQATQLQKFAEDFTKANQTITSLVELVGKIIETPTAESVVGDKNNFSTQKVDSKADRIKELADTLSKIKNK